MQKENKFIEEQQRADSDNEVLWVGIQGGMEEEIVKRHRVAFESIAAAGVHGVNPLQLPKNFYQLGKGFLQAQRILAEFKPNVLFFTGGYVAIPMAFASLFPLGKFKKPKRLVFIPDIEPGLALKALIRIADGVAVSTEETIRFLPRNKIVIRSGYPVRKGFYEGERSVARQHFGLEDDLPALLIFGGSLGARSINRAILKIIRQLLPEMYVIHITGKSDWEEVRLEKEQIQRVDSHLADRYQLYDYLHEDMPLALRAADLVVCRSGASVLGELPAIGVAAILVPYPYAWRYQETNAAYLVKHGAAIMLKDEELQEKFLPTIVNCIRDKNKLNQMSCAMKQLAKPEAAKVIVRSIYSLGSEQRGMTW